MEPNSVVKIECWIVTSSDPRMPKSDTTREISFVLPMWSRSSKEDCKKNGSGLFLGPNKCI